MALFIGARLVVGLRRFTLHGQDKVDGQWHLFCLVHNIEKIAKYGKLLGKVH